MRLTILGSGTSVPHGRRAASAHWLETNTGTVLLDAGADAAHRAAEENLAWAELDAIWISHFHLDHIGVLPALLFGTKYARETQARRNPLTIFGPSGLKKLIEAFDGANEYNLLKQPFPIEVREVAPREDFEILQNVKAQTFSTPHTGESLAVRIKDAGGASLVYSSDTGYAEVLGEFAKDADLFLLECSFPSDKPVETHLILEEACCLARASKARRIILTHLYPEWDNVNFETEVKKYFDGAISLGFDGLKAHIEPSAD